LSTSIVKPQSQEADQNDIKKAPIKKRIAEDTKIPQKTIRANGMKDIQELIGCYDALIWWDVTEQASLKLFDCEMGEYANKTSLIFTIGLKNPTEQPHRYRVNIFLEDMDKAAGYYVPRKGNPPVVNPGEHVAVKIPFIGTDRPPKKIKVVVSTMSNESPPVSSGGSAATTTASPSIIQPQSQEADQKAKKETPKIKRRTKDNIDFGQEKETPKIKRWTKDNIPVGSKVKQTQMSRLFVFTVPEIANIRVLNIKSEFYQGMMLKPGRYEIEVSADGYEPVIKPVNLRAGNNRFNIKLEISDREPSSSYDYGAGKGEGDYSGKGKGYSIVYDLYYNLMLYPESGDALIQENKRLFNKDFFSCLDVVQQRAMQDAQRHTNVCNQNTSSDDRAQCEKNNEGAKLFTWIKDIRSASRGDMPWSETFAGSTMIMAKRELERVRPGEYERIVRDGMQQIRPLLICN
jgi:hypothetical protein